MLLHEEEEDPTDEATTLCCSVDDATPRPAVTREDDALSDMTATIDQASVCCVLSRVDVRGRMVLMAGECVLLLSS